MGHNVLTAKQEEFCRLVAQGETYADAYKGSYNAKKMGINTIYVKASQFMDQDKIKVRVEAIRQETIARNQVTVDQVLEQLANWLLFDPLSIINEETECVKSMKSIEKKDRMSLAEIQVQELWGYEDSVTDPKKKIRVKTGELKKIKFVDKRATAEMFMKKFGQYVPDGGTIADNLDAIRDIIKQVKG